MSSAVNCHFSAVSDITKKSNQDQVSLNTDQLPQEDVAQVLKRNIEILYWKVSPLTCHI